MNIVSRSSVIENPDEPNGIQFCGLVQLTEQEVKSLEAVADVDGGEFAAYISTQLLAHINSDGQMRYKGINVHTNFKDRTVWHFELRMEIDVNTEQRNRNWRAVYG